MKTTHLMLSVLLTALPLAAAHSQSSKMEEKDKMAMPSKDSTATHKATGIVKSTDAAKNSVTLAHDPVKSLDWPSMTMKFMIKDKALLDKLTPGKKVEFDFVQQGKEYVVTDVR